MADRGVTTKMGSQKFLDAIAVHKQADPTMALLLNAIKSTAKGSIGKLRQRSRGQVPYYEPWPTLKRETWRPDIRAAVLSTVRIGGGVPAPEDWCWRASVTSSVLALT